MAERPDITALPAVLILTLFCLVLGSVSGFALGILNGLLVVVVIISVGWLTPGQSRSAQAVLVGSVGILAGIVNFVAVHAVLNWWLSGGTISWMQAPLAFGWLSAVLTDLAVVTWVQHNRLPRLG